MDDYKIIIYRRYFQCRLASLLTYVKLLEEEAAVVLHLHVKLLEEEAAVVLHLHHHTILLLYSAVFPPIPYL